MSRSHGPASRWARLALRASLAGGRTITTDEPLICEVCGEPIKTGDAVVLGQEADGITLLGLQDAAADGRLAMFHAGHWPDRIGDWVERDRGHATGP